MSYAVEDGVVRGRDGDIRIRDYRPVNVTAPAPFLWVHGGGFVLGGLDQTESDAPARFLAAAGHWVRTLDYRLAPNIGLFREPTLGPAPGRFPAAHHDVIDVATALRAEGGVSVDIGGASAGANLAAGAVLAMRDGGMETPRSVVLAYGALHSAIPEDAQVESSLRGPLARWFFNPAMTRRMNVNYVGEVAGLGQAYAFPGGSDLHGFPPTLVLDASNDRLRGSGHAFAEELRSAGSVGERGRRDGSARLSGLAPAAAVRDRHDSDRRLAAALTGYGPRGPPPVTHDLDAAVNQLWSIFHGARPASESWVAASAPPSPTSSGRNGPPIRTSGSSSTFSSRACAASR